MQKQHTIKQHDTFTHEYNLRELRDMFIKCVTHINKHTHTIDVYTCAIDNTTHTLTIEYVQYYTHINCALSLIDDVCAYARVLQCTHNTSSSQIDFDTCA